jgi:hypothetical protein
MSPNAFIGKAEQPTDGDLTAMLGPARATWDQLIDDLAREHGANVQEWNSYSPKAGWSLRVKRKERTIVWLAPCPGSFRVAFILGDKAVRAAQQAKLPKRVLQMINKAKKYAEGRGIRLEPKTPKDIETVKKLAVIKLAN